MGIVRTAFCIATADVSFSYEGRPVRLRETIPQSILLKAVGEDGIARLRESMNANSDDIQTVIALQSAIVKEALRIGKIPLLPDRTYLALVTPNIIPLVLAVARDAVEDYFRNVYNIHFPPIGLNNLPKGDVRVLSVNATGAGIGDILTGTPAINAIYEYWRARGTNITFDFLVHEGAFLHCASIMRYYPWFGGVIECAMTIERLQDYHAIIDTSGFIASKPFNSMDVYDFWAQYFTLPETPKPMLPRIDRRIADECMRAVNEAASKYARPTCFFAPYATFPRAMPYDLWEKAITWISNQGFLPVMALHHAIAKEAAPYIPQKHATPIINLSHLSRWSVDHLIGIIGACNAALTVDTSALHIAGITKRPTTAVFFSIPPEQRTRYYPTVKPYVHPSWTTSPFRNTHSIQLTTVGPNLTPTKIPDYDAKTAEANKLWHNIEFDKLPPLEAAKPWSPPHVWTKPRHRTLIVYYYPSPTDFFIQTTRLAISPVLKGYDNVIFASAYPIEIEASSSANALIIASWFDITLFSQTYAPDLLCSSKSTVAVGSIHPNAPIDITKRFLSRLSAYFAPTSSDLATAATLCPKLNALWLGEPAATIHIPHKPRSNAPNYNLDPVIASPADVSLKLDWISDFSHPSTSSRPAAAVALSSASSIRYTGFDGFPLDLNLPLDGSPIPPHAPHNYRTRTRTALNTLLTTIAP